MTVKVLGPLETSASSLSPRERTVLSALIVRLGSAVAPSELADALWAEDAPSTWPQQIKNSIARIRTQLGHDAVVTHGSQYQLGLEPESIDAVRFERLVSRARQHGLRDEWDRAVDAYSRALGLWRGEPLPDVRSWAPGAAEARRLNEVRVSAEEERLDALLHRGEHRTVLPEAERLVRDDPLREDRWAILALANYQSGRQAEALSALRAARARLVDELGVEPGARLRDLETAILRQDPALLAEVYEPASGECPYPGLHAFAEADAERFFGRDGDIETLLERARPGAIIAISGPSGSGKSSLMLAGVIPRLISGGHEVRVLRPGSAGAAAVHHATENGTRVVAIDQAEELLQARDAEIEAFCAASHRFVSGGGTVILTVRSDFLDRLATLPHVGAAIGRGVYVLAPLTPEALRAAIDGPARAARLRCEPGLVELVLRDAADRASTLPHVAHALQQTWLRREGDVLTVEGYETAGGIAGSIGQSAESMYQALAPREQQACRSLMLRLVRRGADGSSTRRRVASAPLLADATLAPVIGRLIDARLVSADGEAIVVAHEAVATAWPRLDDWLQEDADGARLMDQLAAGAQEWEDDERSDDSLLRGSRLHAVLEWSRAANPQLTESERAFLDASTDRDESEIRELAHRTTLARRQNRTLRSSLGAVAVLLVGVMIAGGVAASRGADATAAADDSQIAAATALSRSLRTTERSIAALIAAETYRRWPDDPRAHAAMAEAITEAGGYVASVPIPDARERIGAWPIPGTDTVAVVREKVHLEIRDGQTGDVVRVVSDDLPLPNQPVRPWVRVSDDGSTIVIAQHYERLTTESSDERILFYDVASGELRADVLVEDTVSETLAVSPDGSKATWATMGEVIVVDRDTQDAQRTAVTGLVSVNHRTAAASTFAPDGALVVTTAAGGLLRIDPETLAVESMREYTPDFVGTGVEVAEDGTIFAIGDLGATVIAADGNVLWDRRFERFWECSRIAVSSVAQRAICGDESGNVQQWDLTTGDRAAPPFEHEWSGTGDLAFVADDTEVLFLSAIAPVIGRFRVDGTGPATELIFPGEVPIRAVAQLDATGELMVTANSDDQWVDEPRQARYTVRDIATGKAVLRIPEDVAAPTGRFLSDPRWWARDTLIAWDVSEANPDEDFRFALIDVSDRSVSYPDVPEDAWDMFPGQDLSRGYLVTGSGSILPVDPLTFEPAGPTLTPPREHEEDEAGRGAFSVRSTPDGERVIAIYHYPDQAASLQTVLFDGRTGEVRATTEDRFHVTWMTRDGRIFAADNFQLVELSPEDLSVIGTFANASSLVDLGADAGGDLLMAMVAGPGEVGIIDLETDRPVGGRIALSGPPTSSPVIAPDGSSLYFPVSSGTAALSLDPADHFAALCRLAGRELTAEEWETYLSDLGPQVATCEGVLG